MMIISPLSPVDLLRCGRQRKEWDDAPSPLLSLLSFFAARRSPKRATRYDQQMRNSVLFVPFSLPPYLNDRDRLQHPDLRAQMSDRSPGAARRRCRSSLSFLGKTTGLKRTRERGQRAACPGPCPPLFFSQAAPRPPPEARICSTAQGTRKTERISRRVF